MFAMEDQGADYALDAASGRLEDIASFADGLPAGYVELPQWGPTDGFRMMERFVAVVRDTALQRELRSILFSGKGVFKNFKNLLKSHPQGEKQWFAFREKEMTGYITLWYNQLREAHGLELLGEEPEDTEELLQDDFIFREYEAAKDKEQATLAANNFMAEREAQWPGEIGLALSSLWQENRAGGESERFLSLVAETVGGDFAGCIEARVYPSHARETLLLTSFFVLGRYRGLGIGKKLLEQCALQVQEKGIRWIILADPIIPVFLQTCLTRIGFVSSGGGYILDTHQKPMATETFERDA